MLRWTATSALLALALLVIAPGEAQQAPGDSEPGGQPANRSPAVADSARLAPRRAYFDRSGWVMARSALIPGWGQAKNAKWLKALIVAGIEGAFFERLVFENGRVHYYRDRAAELPAEQEGKRAYYEAKVERHEDHRRDFIWWTSLAVALAMGDAYVDAQLRDFDVELQAEPEPVGASEGGGLRLRLSIGRHL